MYAVLLAAALGAGPVLAAELKVGSNIADCDFTSLALALAFAGDGDSLEVEGRTWTGVTDVNFNISNKSLVVTGGFDADCTSTETSTPTVLAGLGTGAVVEIQSASFEVVTLRRLEIRDGQGDDGGGVAITGAAFVVLDDVLVADNDATRGAVIFLDGTAGADLRIEGGMLERNTASGDGGGVFCTGDARLELAAGVGLVDNGGYNGGGIYASDCYVVLNLDSGQQIDFFCNAAAVRGGGIFLDSLSSLVDQVGAIPARAVFASNSAYDRGGGLMVGGGSSAELHSTAFIANTANYGAGLAVVDSGSVLGLQAAPDGCTLGPCHVIGSNGATAPGILGGAFLIQDGLLLAESTWIGDNVAKEAGIGFVNQAGGVLMTGVVAVRNESSEGTVGLHVGSNSILVLNGATFAEQGDTITNLFEGFGTVDADHLIASGNPSDLFSSIVSWDLDCAVLTTGLPGGPHPQVSNVVIADPLFVDPAGGDYHIQPGSPARDLCATVNTAVDIDGEVRPDGGGFDAGADEITGLIFYDGFESGDTTAWGSPTG